MLFGEFEELDEDGQSGEDGSAGGAEEGVEVGAEGEAYGGSWGCGRRDGLLVFPLLFLFHIGGRRGQFGLTPPLHQPLKPPRWNLINHIFQSR